MPQPGLEMGGRIVEVQDRTRESFQRLASAELPALYWLARRLVRDGAEDLVQGALLRAYRSYGTLRQDTAAGPWLKSILFATKEIARLLDVPLGTVLARLHRGRKRFEQELWAYAQETGLLLRGTVR
jgi:DNA-directed RNA polymerase specialized sigma24 family protein